jgi:hypothetical protein
MNKGKTPASKARHEGFQSAEEHALTQATKFVFTQLKTQPPAADDRLRTAPTDAPAKRPAAQWTAFIGQLPLDHRQGKR